MCVHIYIYVNICIYIFFPCMNVHLFLFWKHAFCHLRVIPCSMMIIAFIAIKSCLVFLIEGLCARIYYFRFEICMYVHSTYVWTYVYNELHLQYYICMHFCTSLHVYMMCVQTHLCIWSMHACVFSGMCACIHIRTLAFVCIYTSMCTPMRSKTLQRDPGTHVLLQLVA